jgi:hypothetical protein
LPHQHANFLASFPPAFSIHLRAAPSSLKEEPLFFSLMSAAAQLTAHEWREKRLPEWTIGGEKDFLI